MSIALKRRSSLFECVCLLSLFNELEISALRDYIRDLLFLEMMVIERQHTVIVQHFLILLGFSVLSWDSLDVVLEGLLPFLTPELSVILVVIPAVFRAQRFFILFTKRPVPFLMELALETIGFVTMVSSKTSEQ
jgi:hypothetical protein